MSDNPFRDPPPQQSAPGQTSQSEALPQSFPPVAPGALTPILVFCLLLGIAGLLFNCFAGGMSLAMPMLGEVIENSPVPEEQKVFTKFTIAAQKSTLLPQLIVICISFVVSLMMIVGSIGCMKRREKSRDLLRTGLLAAIVYSILKLVVNIYSYLSSNAALIESVEKMAGDPMYDELKSQMASNSFSVIATTAVITVIGLAIMAFYFWARSYLGKKAVEDYFVAFNAYRQGQ